MDRQDPRTRLRNEISGLVRLYRAMDGTAIGLASVSMDGLDQTWRDRVQRIRALPREAPRRKQMIEALIKLVEHTLWKRQAEIQTLRATDSTLASDALVIAERGKPAPEEATPHPDAA